MLEFSCLFANGQLMMNAPFLVWSLKLSNSEPSQYLDGWPPGNTGCCWLSFFSWFKTIFWTFWPTFEFFRTWFIFFLFETLLFCILGTFNEWGTWSSCSVTCGSGTRSRSRTCPGPHQCQGDTTESDTCPDNPTCYSEFSHIYFGPKINFWSTCLEICLKQS